MKGFEMFKPSRIALFFLFTLLAAAASAAPAAARIVYTRANVTIDGDATLPIDLNNDGTADIILHQSFRQQCFVVDLGAYGATQGDGALGGFNSPDGPLAAALPQGSPIGPAQPYNGFAILTDIYGAMLCPPPGHDYGYWQNAGPHYLGMVFVKNGKTRYGWAELNVSVCNIPRCGGIRTTLMGYAYETIPGKSIPAGKT